MSSTSPSYDLLISLLIDYLTLNDLILSNSDCCISDSIPLAFFTRSALLRNELEIAEGPELILAFTSNSIFYGGA